MPYTISQSTDGKYILMKVDGQLTRESAFEGVLEAHALGKKLGINRHLVDVTEARNVESPVAVYGFAYDDMAHLPDIDRYALAAILASPEDHSHDFIETVLRNAGINVTLFRDRRLAIRHLEEGISSDKSDD